jgi:uncharacterized protein YuzE
VEAISHTSTPSVRIGEPVFDDVSYDARGDVLYLSIGRRAPRRTPKRVPRATPSALDAEGRVIGVTLVSPRHLLERDGALVITLPSRERVDAEELAAALAS